ncbi:murein biosynthesis integral membrane protein MurJ [Nonomuraea sp. C10]|uniref:murein biosynthesis integral membrane protein MurJ n=1 Tax=Nonomuraea sp. C10 TaxID=2600577 RepID=UPI0011CD7624|nr:lipid II flippase MurJ [Nonomuraea sp. C10]TXK40433.1 virulence factor MviN [Nonomuraea sp. C10]
MTEREARLARGVAGGALLIGAITVLARVAGFAKQYALARTVGTNCLTSAYFTANQIPNIVFEVVVGGALAGMVVPVLAGAVSEDARERVGRIASALLTWVLVVLVPVAVLTALLAGPIMGLFAIEGCGRAAVDVAARMLVIFAPQIPLYGIAVVLYGLLQAHHRFAGPALAPLVSSIVVIVAYLMFVPLSGGIATPERVPRAAELALSAGTSLGVLALVLTVIGPTARLGVRWRPTLRFPDGVAGQVRRLALAGIAGLLAQQAAMVVVLLLANDVIGGGALAVYNYAWAIYLVPYAVLAVPIATSAFPRLSAHAGVGEDEAFARLAASTTRAIVLVSGVAAGVLAAASEPGAAVFLADKSDVDPLALARAVALFAPGLIGYGLIAHLSRVLYATGRGRGAAVGTVSGWSVTIVAQTVFALSLPDGWRIAGLGLGMTVGMTAGGALMLGYVVAARGRAAMAGLGRALGAAVAGGAAGFLAGAWAASGIGAHGVWANLGVTLLAAVVAVAVGAGVVVLVDRDDARAVAGVLRRRAPGG